MCDLSILRGLQGRDVPFVGCGTDVEIDFWNQSPIGSGRIQTSPEDPESGQHTSTSQSARLFAG